MLDGKNIRKTKVEMINEIRNSEEGYGEKD